MGNLSVLFNIPTWLEMGLSNGEYQRIGGVIVDNSTKQIIAWLRESSVIEQVTTEALPALASGVLQFAKIAPVINLGVMVTGFIHLNNRLEGLSRNIDRLNATIRAEFQRDRHTDFKVALEAVHDVLEGGDASRIQSALDGLVKARENCLKDFEQLLNGQLSDAERQLAHHLLVTASYIEITRIRCYIANGQSQLAHKKLKESLPIFHSATQKFVQACLGNHPALFLHKDFEDDTVARLFRVQAWIMQDSDNAISHNYSVLEILNLLRKDFWDTDLVSDKHDTIFHQAIRRPTVTWNNLYQQLKAGLGYAEVAIENYQRLQGFDLELRSQRLAHVDIDEDMLAHYGMALIMDEEVLDAIAWKHSSNPLRQ